MADIVDLLDWSERLFAAVALGLLEMNEFCEWFRFNAEELKYKTVNFLHAVTRLNVMRFSIHVDKARQL